MPLRPVLRWTLAVALLVTVCGMGFVFVFIAPIGSAYVAKTICSGVFITGRPSEEVQRVDVIADNNPLLPLFDYAVDHVRRQVEARFLGLQARVAQFRPGSGCAVTFGRILRGHETPPLRTPFVPLPTTDPSVLGVNGRALTGAVLAAFDEPNLDALRRTHAVLVMHRGRLISEHYASGYDAATPHIGWSMTKTVTALLVGIRVSEGHLRLDQVALRPEWRQDARSAISLSHLLQMSSGLAFDENYNNPRSDVVRMLNEDGDFARYAIGAALVSRPGEAFRYSSGSTVILSRILRDSFYGDDELYWAYPHKALLAPLGVGSATLEVDASGTLVGASSMYAGAHDWARIGQLLLDGGVRDRKRLVSQDWIRFMTTPAASASRAEYGAHLWTSIPAPFTRLGESRPVLPPDAFHLVGFEGQFVSVIPSHDLVVVRLGLSRRAHSWDHEALLDAIVRIVPRRTPAASQ